MKVLRLLVIAVVAAGLCSTAAAQVFSEDFESYEAGSDLQGQGGWKGWGNDAAYSAPVSDAYASSGSNSVEIISSADFVHEFDVSGGKWVFTTMQYIPSGTTGTHYFIMLNTYDDAGNNRDWSIQTLFVLSDGTLNSYYVDGSEAEIIYDEWVEVKLIIDLDRNTVDEYYNGVMFATHDWDDGQAGTIGCLDLYGNGASSVYYDDIVLQSYTEYASKAIDPSPSDAATDQLRDVTLSWTPGEEITTHDVYFGTAFADVNAATRSNPADALVSQGQAAATFDPEGLLEFGQTYYWRVDEVADDGTIYPGKVWSFTAEPYMYAIEGITATSNGTSEAGVGPEKTIDGSGLNDADQHSIADADMWLGAPNADGTLYVQYDFDGVYKLYDMLVWNYNGEFEMLLAFGIQDVTIEYSADGVEWTVLGDVTLAQGTAMGDYTANTTIEFGGVPAKAVRLTVNSGYGAFGQYGLSEVRFLYIPAQARKPQPADGATDVAFDTVLSWRAGREAASHEVYLSTDGAAVVDGTALAGTASVPSFDAGALEFAMTYYWKVVEVNDAEAITAWASNVWTFATEEFGTIDGFESYDDDSNRIYDTWVDGWINGSSAIVGYVTEPFAEQSIINSGIQSLPLEYDNGVAPYYSETSRTWSSVQDWTAGAADTLTLYVHGAADNAAEPLYVAVEDSSGSVAVVTYSNLEVATTEAWLQWQIPLSDLAGVNLAAVESLHIGLGDRDNPSAGGAGIVYIDDVGFGTPLSHKMTVDVTGAGDAIQGVPNDGDWPAAETPDLAIDDDTSTKFLHFKGETEPTGFQVTPSVGATVVTEIALTTANDAAERDPASFELYGSNDSIDGPYTLIASGDVVDFAGEAAWERFTKNTTPITFDNDVAYTHYQLLFPTVRDASSANSMQIGEVELIGVVAP